jgi:hypothetical protein
VRSRDELYRLSGIALLALVGCASGDDSAIVPLEDGGGQGPTSDAALLLDAPAPFDGGEPSSDAGGSSVDSNPLTSETEAGSHDSGLQTSGGDAGESNALIGKWNFDEGTGTTSADLSGQGHPATLVGGASWAVAGKEGTGLALDGVTGYADIGSTLINTTASFSVLCWANLTVVNSWEIALSQDDVTGSLFGLKLRGDGTNTFDFDVETSDVMTPGFVVAQSTTTAVAATWVHLAGVYDASAGSLTLYVNGAAQADAAVGQSLLASSGHFVIGRGLYNGVTGSFLNGTLDEVEVHAAALTSAQVAAIYAAEQ